MAMAIQWEGGVRKAGTTVWVDGGECRGGQPCKIQIPNDMNGDIRAGEKILILIKIQPFFYICNGIITAGNCRLNSGNRSAGISRKERCIRGCYSNSNNDLAAIGRHGQHIAVYRAAASAGQAESSIGILDNAQLDTLAAVGIVGLHNLAIVDQLNLAGCIGSSAKFHTLFGGGIVEDGIGSCRCIGAISRLTAGHGCCTNNRAQGRTALIISGNCLIGIGILERHSWLRFGSSCKHRDTCNRCGGRTVVIILKNHTIRIKNTTIVIGNQADFTIHGLHHIVQSDNIIHIDGNVITRIPIGVNTTFDITDHQTVVVITAGIHGISAHINILEIICTGLAGIVVCFTK